MSFLFGSAPSVKTTTSPTINPTQENILNALAGFMQSGAPAPGVQPYQGTFSAPLSGLQNMSLAGLEHFASNVIPNMPQLDPTQAFQALSKGLNYGGPGQVSAPTVQAQQIDPSQVIQQSVVDPLTKAFNDRILPAITGKYGASAGGGFSSDAMEARRQAGSDLESNHRDGGRATWVQRGQCKPGSEPVGSHHHGGRRPDCGRPKHRCERVWAECDPASTWPSSRDLRHSRGGSIYYGEFARWYVGGRCGASTATADASRGTGQRLLQSDTADVATDGIGD